MNSLINNRIVQLVGLTVGLAIVLYMVTWVLFRAIGVIDAIPFAGHAAVALLAGGYIVAKYYAFRVG